jgi:hypothetical protein
MAERLRVIKAWCGTAARSAVVGLVAVAAVAAVAVEAAVAKSQSLSLSQQSCRGWKKTLECW